MTSRYSIYIPIGLTYREYRVEYFAAFIDSGSGTCLCRPECYPQAYKKDLPRIKGKDISNNIIEINKGIEKLIILLGSFLIKCPPFYFHNTVTDILLENNFLQLFHKVTFDTVANQILFKTPCHHLIAVKKLKQAYAKPFPITFIPRIAQRGDLGYIENSIFPKTKPLLQYQIELRQLDSTGL